MSDDLVVAVERRGANSCAPTADGEELMNANDEHWQAYSRLEVPLYPGTLRGYRIWGVSSDGLISTVGTKPHYDAETRGLHMPPHSWTRGVNAAGCGRTRTFYVSNGSVFATYGAGPGLQIKGALPGQEELFGQPNSWTVIEVEPTHPSPQLDCKCGFYALHDPKYISNAHGIANWHALPLFGSVKASGRIVLGSQGFRSEFVEIEALCVDAHCNGSKFNNASRLGKWHAEKLDVPFFDAPRDLIEAYPPQSIAEFLGDVDVD